MAALPSVGATEMLIVLGIVALLFGARRIPELARSIGQGLGELRRAARDEAAPGSEAE